MKKTVRFLALILLISAFLSDLSACRRLRNLVFGSRETSAEEPSALRYLFVGLDDAAENTDVLLSVGFRPEENALNLVQIPRDTYCRFGGSQNKINQFFAYRRLKGASEKEALLALRSLLEETLGVTYDGVFAIGTAAFRDLVDALGGIDVTLDAPLALSVDHEEMTLEAGKNHLNGALAERFVRNRKGYSGGDLSRLDAQKVFFKAVFERFRSGITLAEALPAVRILCTEGITDLSIADAAALYRKYRPLMASASVNCLTLPGAPTVSESGLSYYIIARKGASCVAKNALFAEEAFDPECRFFDEARQNFSDIYFDTGIGVPIVSPP